MSRGTCIALLALILAALAALSGCGDVTYQTRYLPRASELTWDEDINQLPWREPALDGAHYTRNQAPAKPMFKEDLSVDTEWAMQDTHYQGDGDLADRGDSE
ncbi:MAG: hypothetical protein PF961_03835 [Planctomycetota bacterium]|jgi:hypothetical protein|nr:hypothetical protein [Planctomycetota bacterium]